jgi:hypothetical protein
MTYKYTTDHNNRAIEVDDPTAADELDVVQTFASRLARREFGKKGRALTLRWDSTRRDGKSSLYESFLGYRCGDAYSGHNIWIWVTKEAV